MSQGTSNQSQSGYGGLIKPYTGGRKGKGYSLRESLECQGVTSEQAMRDHLNLVYGTLQANPDVDITRYRVDPNNPNNLAMG